MVLSNSDILIGQIRVCWIKKGNLDINHLEQKAIYLKLNLSIKSILIKFKKFSTVAIIFIKGYLHYRTITPQSVLSEEQIKNFFIS